MDLVGIVVGIINTVFLVVLLFLILKKGTGNDLAIEPFRTEVRLSSSELRQDLSARRSELKESLGQGQQQVESRVSAGAQAQGEELAREREARQKAHAEFREAMARGLGDLTEQFHAHSKSAVAFHSEARASRSSAGGVEAGGKPELGEGNHRASEDHFREVYRAPLQH